MDTQQTLIIPTVAVLMGCIHLYFYSNTFVNATMDTVMSGIKQHTEHPAYT